MIPLAACSAAAHQSTMGLPVQSSPNIVPLIERGRTLMRAREWQRALDTFSEATAADAHAPAAWEAFASAAMCVDDFDGARAALERAFREAQFLSDWRTASRAAMQLAVFHECFRGESAIASGWFERARTLLNDRDIVAEHAWLALWEAHILIHMQGDVPAGQRKLEEALRLKSVCGISGDFDLLTRGLGGLLAVADGAVREGLRRLDEVSATAVTELPSPDIVGWACCYVLDACERVRDFDRAVQWIERGLEAGRQLHIPRFVAFCRSHFLSVLIGRGEYEAAEREAETTRRAIEKIAPAYGAQCEIWIGEIRRRQGDLDAAEALLARHSSRPLAMLSLAALALDRGAAERALDLAERYLRRVSPFDRLRRLHGLEPLVRAHVRLAHDEGVRECITELRRFADDPGAPLIAALVNDIEGLAASVHGDFEQARRRLEDAVDAYEINAAPYEAAAARLELGEVLQRLGRQDSARAAFAFAKKTAERLGAKLLLERAQRALDKPQSTSRAVPTDLTGRELQVLSLVAKGVSNQEIGDRLCISAFTVKRHIANILMKLDQPSRAAAAAHAIRAGLL